MSTFVKNKPYIISQNTNIHTLKFLDVNIVLTQLMLKKLKLKIDAVKENEFKLFIDGGILNTNNSVILY
jgi:hypothetical protein